MKSTFLGALAALAPVLAAALVASACEPPPPIKTASGERIDSVSFEEKFPLSNDGNEVTFHGDRLRKAVAMMDRAGVMSMSGDYAVGGVLDKSTLVLTVVTTDKRERRLTVKNCSEPHLCAFFADAVKNGVVEKTPVVCRDAPACTKK